ncbi:AraC family transcriptional regulator [Paenibacillus camerounensis]|uniref:AraC family transcriptional regulator n=1 Tax=Paenibacillus camerounensis TaxID=1243663 RepID=UPI000A31EB01|nr:AraC family transcriptional regulator [Paenibacillus camerounensis]
MLLDQHEHIRLWDQAFIHNIEVKRFTLGAGERRSVAFKSSGFLCVGKGSSLVLLDQHSYPMHSMQLLHAPAKSFFEVSAGVGGAEYSIVLYEADTGRMSAEDQLLLDKCNPFRTSYHVNPDQPVNMYDSLGSMLELSQYPEQTGVLPVKALFYHWVSQVIEQYHARQPASIAASPAQLVTQTLEYMLQHYSAAHTLDSLAVVINRSPGHLSNCFKQVLDRGPIDCLIRLRIQKACELLAGTKLTVRAIAAAVGYQDVYYFSNAFKKQKGISPALYRKRLRNEDFTLDTGRKPIVGPEQPCYIASCDNENYYHYNDRSNGQYSDGGSTPMFNKRKSVPAVLLLAFGLVLGACGGGGNINNAASAAETTSQPQASVEATASPVADSSSGTRVVTTTMGKVEVPASPQRTVTDFYLGYLLAMDIKPVGSNGLFMKNPYLDGMVDGITDVSDNLEAIISLNPDLIVTGDAEKYEAYSQIAPTVYLEVNTNLHEQVMQLGEILNKQQEAESWLSAFDEKLAVAKKRVNAVLKEGETVTVFDGGLMKDVTLYGNAYTGKTIHGELEMPMNGNVVRDMDPKVGWMTVSSEVVNEYAGDHIFMAVDASKESYDYGKDPVWGTVEAVKQNELYEFDGYRFYFSDPISVEGQIEDIADMMEERAATKSR